MKKLTILSALATVVLAGICFEGIRPQPTQASAPLQTLTSGYGPWRVNVGVTLLQTARVTLVNLSTSRNITFQCLVFDKTGLKSSLRNRYRCPPADSAMSI